MSHVSHPRLPIRVSLPGKRSKAVAGTRAAAPTARSESIAAPLTLAAVVVADLAVAVAVTLVTAL